MDTNEEFESSSGTDVVGQLLSTKTSTLALMTTSILLFLTLVAKRLSSKQSEVSKCGFVLSSIGSQITSVGIFNRTGIGVVLLLQYSVCIIP